MSRHDQMAAGGSALPAPVDGAGGEILSPLGSRSPGRSSNRLSPHRFRICSRTATTMPRATCSRRSSSRQQRRASRIAWHYLRDVAEADEAVQDAFVKAYTHIKSFQRNLSFEVWLTRILINGCLDRQKARTRRSRWMMPVADAGRRDQDTIERATRPSRSIAGSAAPRARMARPADGRGAQAARIGSGWCSCSAITPIIRRATSPR